MLLFVAINNVIEKKKNLKNVSKER